MRRRTFLSEFTPQRTTLTHSHPALPHFLQVRLGAGGECPKRRASSPYIVPRWAIPETHHWATPETRHWATPQDPALRRATPGLRQAPVRLPSGTCPPPSGARPPSVGHPSGSPSTLLAHWVSRASPSGHSVGLLRRATPSGPPSHSLYKYPCLP
jgi:hypothetical protein